MPHLMLLITFMSRHIVKRMRCAMMTIIRIKMVRIDIIIHSSSLHRIVEIICHHHSRLPHNSPIIIAMDMLHSRRHRGHLAAIIIIHSNSRLLAIAHYHRILDIIAIHSSSSNSRALKKIHSSRSNSHKPPKHHHHQDRPSHSNRVAVMLIIIRTTTIIAIIIAIIVIIIIRILIQISLDIHSSRQVLSRLMQERVRELKTVSFLVLLGWSWIFNQNNSGLASQEAFDYVFKEEPQN